MIRLTVMALALLLGHATIADNRARAGLFDDVKNVFGGGADKTHLQQLQPDAEEQLSVCIETAHPAKFPEEIQATVGVDPDLPPSLAGLEELEERYTQTSTDYASFRDRLIDQYAQ